ncbi:hypothetical protein pipiens_008511 [Culex pipiens pipiens]|uniref:Phosphatase and actin regulator 1 n=1 Tax=Culex pipiens pipiens TaxID=38569 RepID=A0ABD1DH70_CULPP
MPRQCVNVRGVATKKQNGATLRSNSLNSGSRTPPLERKSKFSAFGRLFKPWKWRRKKKSEKFESTSKSLERKISVRANREELVQKGILLPESPTSALSIADEEQYTIYNSVNGSNSAVLPNLANASSSAAAAPNTSITNNVPLSQSAQQISSVLSNSSLNHPSNNNNNNSTSSSNSNGPLSLASILGGGNSGNNAVIGANMIGGGTAGQALASILTGNSVGNSIGGSGGGGQGGLSHSQSAHQIGSGVTGGGHAPISQHQALQQQLQQHFANVAGNSSSLVGWGRRNPLFKSVKNL